MSVTGDDKNDLVKVFDTLAWKSIIQNDIAIRITEASLKIDKKGMQLGIKKLDSNSVQEEEF